MAIKPIKVLIIEDSSPVRERLADLLNTFEDVNVVGEAADARAGVELVQALGPDIVTLDIHIPDASGFDVLASGLDVLTQIKANPPVPMVIVLTNYPYPAYRQRCLELGADFFFDKSLEFGKVLEIVSQARRRPPAAPR